jgi:hypothetical protein
MAQYITSKYSNSLKKNWKMTIAKEKDINNSIKKERKAFFIYLHNLLSIEIKDTNKRLE